VWDGVRDICFFFTSGPGTTGTFTALRTLANPRHSLNVFQATTQTPQSVADYAMKVAISFLPGTPLYQENQPASTFLINGVIGNIAVPATVTEMVGVPVNVGYLSSNLGFGWELVLTLPSALLPVGGGATVTPGAQQILNVDLGAPLVMYLNSLTFPPFAGNTFLQVSGTAPLQIAGQMIVLDPTNPDGFALSAASRLHIQ
jgi:hypothetical protein